MKMIWWYKNMKMVWRWYEDMKMVWKYEDDMKIWSCSTCPSSARVRTCRVQSACCSPSPSVSAGWLKAEYCSTTGSLGLYLYNAAGYIQYYDTFPFCDPKHFDFPHHWHHDNKIRDNVINVLWGLLTKAHDNIKIFCYCWLNAERFAMVFTFADIWFAIFE